MNLMYEVDGRRTGRSIVELFNLRASRRKAGSDLGFTLVEVATVVLLIGLIVGIAVIVFVGALRKADVNAAAEMLKGDISKLYMRADSQDRTGTYKEGEPDRYRIEFHTSTGEEPHNAYKFLIQTKTGPGVDEWSEWTDLPEPDQGTYNALAANPGDGKLIWIKTCTGNDLRIMPSITSGVIDYEYIDFIPIGSTTRARIDYSTPAEQPMTITLTSASTGKKAVVNISDMGDLWLSN